MKPFIGICVILALIGLTWWIHERKARRRAKRIHNALWALYKLQFLQYIRARSRISTSASFQSRGFYMPWQSKELDDLKMAYELTARRMEHYRAEM